MFGCIIFVRNETRGGSTVLVGKSAPNSEETDFVWRPHCAADSLDKGVFAVVGEWADCIQSARLLVEPAPDFV